MIFNKNIISKLIKLIHSFSTYALLTLNEQLLLLEQLKKINSMFNINISNSQIICMRNTYVYLLFKKKGTKVHKYGENIYNDYNNKISIIDIANKYKLFPYQVFQQILIESKYDSDQIYKMMSFPNLLPLQMKKNAHILLDNNPNLWFNFNLPIQNVYNKLRKLNCEYIVKYDLKKLGKCPDIIMNKNITYNNISFQWIEFKNYMIFDNNIILNDINHIATKYKRFGNGLLLYTDIICSKSFIKHLPVHIQSYHFFE